MKETDTLTFEIHEYIQKKMNIKKSKIIIRHFIFFRNTSKKRKIE